MVYVLVWLFMAYGMTSIIVWGSIFESTRQWIKNNSTFFGDLISCTLCTATWVGFFMSITLCSLTDSLFTTFWLVDVFFDGMFAAGGVWAINTIVEFFEESRIK